MKLFSCAFNDKKSAPKSSLHIKNVRNKKRSSSHRHGPMTQRRKMSGQYSSPSIVNKSNFYPPELSSSTTTKSHRQINGFNVVYPTRRGHPSYLINNVTGIPIPPNNHLSSVTAQPIYQNQSVINNPWMGVPSGDQIFNYLTTSTPTKPTANDILMYGDGSDLMTAKLLRRQRRKVTIIISD